MRDRVNQLCHLNQGIEGHKSFALGKYLTDQHNDKSLDLTNTVILKKCQGTLDCLIYDMLFIHKRKPKLNLQ